MSPRQITLLYGIGGVVLLGALGALYNVELLQLHRIEQDVEVARTEIERLDAIIDGVPVRAAHAQAAERTLSAHRRLLPREVDALAVYDRLLGLRRTHGLSELVVTVTRDEQPGLWSASSPPAYVPPSHPGLRSWTRYIGVAGTYGQILAFLNDLERVDTVQLVRDLVIVRADEPAPGEISVRAGLSLTLYARPRGVSEAGAGSEAPPLTEAERTAILGSPHTLGRAVDDDWMAKGIDWRTTPPDALPARNPFDPFPALTRTKAAAAELDLDALERRLGDIAAAAATSGEGFDAAAAGLARDLGATAPEGRAEAQRWGDVRNRLDTLSTAVGSARGALEACARELAQIEALPADQRTVALARLAALAKANGADSGAPCGAERAALAAQVAAAAARLAGVAQPEPAALEGARAKLAALKAAGAAGELAGLSAGAASLAEIAARFPENAELAAFAHDAQDLDGRARRLTAIVGSLKFTGVVVASGVKHALVAGRRYRAGDRIEADGESLEVLDLDDSRLVLGWKALRASRTK